MDRRQVLIAALRAGAKAVASYDPQQVASRVKSTEGDIVTAADLASQKVIIETIAKAFPGDTIIAEEADDSHHNLNPSELPQLTAWIVDPLDGTNNFKRGLAYSGISIGYVKDGQPVLGGILDFYRDRLFLATVGRGAICNGRPIKVNNRIRFDGGTRVCTSNGADEGSTNFNLQSYFKLGHVWVDVLGSAVLIMGEVAAGHIDLYFHQGLKPWDNAAGFLIAREAGAKIVGLKGQPVNWLSNEAVMGNPKLVDLFIKLTN